MIHAALILSLLGSPFYDNGTGAVVTFPLVCTGDVDLDGNDILDVGTMDFDGTAAKLSSPADGQVTGTNDAGTTGGTLDFTVADMVGVADQAGTGVGDFFVEQGGAVCLNGSACTKSVDADASYAYIRSGTYYVRVASNMLFNGTYFYGQSPSSGFIFYAQNSVADTAGETCGQNVYRGAGNVDYGAEYFYVADGTGSDEDGEYLLRVSNDGALADAVRIDMDDAVENVTFGFPIVVPTYEVCYSTLGAVSPAPGAAPTTAVNTLSVGLAFSHTATQSVYNGFTIPDCWDGASDLTVRIEFMPEAGQAIASGEGVEFDIEYRRAIWGTEDLDNGSSQLVTYTFTGTGGDSAQATYVGEVTIDYDAAGTVLAPGDRVSARFDRDHDDPDDDYPHAIIVTDTLACFQQTTPVCDINN